MGCPKKRASDSGQAHGHIRRPEGNRCAAAFRASVEAAILAASSSDAAIWSASAYGVAGRSDPRALLSASQLTRWAGMPPSGTQLLGERNAQLTAFRASRVNSTSQISPGPRTMNAGRVCLPSRQIGTVFSRGAVTLRRCLLRATPTPFLGHVGPARVMRLPGRASADPGSMQSAAYA
jgi:hypothetical protein